VPSWYAGRLIEQRGYARRTFFYYWEETEWCLRARESGWCIMHVPQARLWHKGVQRDYEPNPSVTYYATRNHLLLLANASRPHRGLDCNLGAAPCGTLASWTIKPPMAVQAGAPGCTVGRGPWIFYVIGGQAFSVR